LRLPLPLGYTDPDQRGALSGMTAAFKTAGRTI
jgi:hypothetical protein